MSKCGRMNLFRYSALLVIGANVAYHICQKSIPTAAHVIVSVIVTFAVAIAVSFIILIFFQPHDNIVPALRKVGWASVFRGLAIIAIEVGYLLLYRSGWHVSLGSVFCNTCVFVILLPVGLILFKEKLILTNYLGVLFALAGIYLMTRGR